MSSVDVHDAQAPSGHLVTVAALAALVAVALAATGVVLARGMVTTGRQYAALQRDASRAFNGPAAVAQDVPTSFGVVAVESVTVNAGPTAKALAGVTHGIQNLVRPDRLQVDATVTLTNQQQKVLRYSPAAFTLYATRGRAPAPGDRPIHLVRASALPGTLQPNAAVDATLTFVLPRDGSKLWMTFVDRGKPIVFDLGRTDRTPPGALNAYHAHGARP